MYPDSIQRLRILNEDKKYFLKKGDTVQMDVVGYMRKLNEVKIPYSELDFYSTNNAVATVDENGLITGVGAGKAAIYVEYLDGDVIRRKYLDIVCDDAVVEITSNVSSTVCLSNPEYRANIPSYELSIGFTFSSSSRYAARPYKSAETPAHTIS